MTLRPLSLLPFALLLLPATSQAASFTFSGNLQYHNDVVQIDFELLEDAFDVAVWTDSFNAGENFDPITAVWKLPSGERVGENDDDDTIAAGQTYYDSGLKFPMLAAGKYAFTITPFNNFAPENLFTPFGYSDQVPIPIGDWCQPASNNCTDQKGTFWRVNLEGVDSAAPIPEPTAMALMSAGLVVLMATLGVRRRERR